MGKTPCAAVAVAGVAVPGVAVAKAKSKVEVEKETTPKAKHKVEVKEETAPKPKTAAAVADKPEAKPLKMTFDCVTSRAHNGMARQKLREGYSLDEANKFGRIAYAEANPETTISWLYTIGLVLGGDFTTRNLAATIKVSTSNHTTHQIKWKNDKTTLRPLTTTADVCDRYSLTATVALCNRRQATERITLRKDGVHIQTQIAR